MKLTRDAFLGGRLSIWQPETGYRAGVDPVFLAAFVAASPGQSVLDLGCGAGVAALALASRVGGLDLAGLELQEEYAELARRNADDNGLQMQVFTGDLACMPAALRGRQFDHVIANPPYIRRGGTPATDPGRETAFAGETPLARWVDAGIRRLKPGGSLTLIQNAERLPDLLAACDGRVGRIEAQPLAPRAGRPAALVLLSAVKGARSPFRLLPPIILHEGAAHARDGDSYTPPVNAVLREGAAFQRHAP